MGSGTEYNPDALRCDRCYSKIPDTQIYPRIWIGLPEQQRTLCKKCVDEYKQVMIPYWNRKISAVIPSKDVGSLQKTYPTGEMIGKPGSFPPYISNIAASLWPNTLKGTGGT